MFMWQVIIDNIIICFLYVLLSQVQLVNMPCNIKSALRIDYLEFCFFNRKF